MRQVELHHGARSDVGLVREVNEDAFLASPPVFVVADGMGGHDGGDVASRIVVEEFARLADDGYGSRSAAATWWRRRCGSASAGSGSTASSRSRSGRPAVRRHDRRRSAAGRRRRAQVAAGDLGDSRIYRLTGDRLEQVSVDHSVVQELVDAGTISSEDAATHPERHVITRALGGPDPAEADYFLLPLPAVERLLLCSDGVSGMIDADAIAAVLRDAEDPRDAADQLVERALAAGGRDNATAVVIDVVGWADDPYYDSHRQRLSLEQKLGALP